MADQKQKRPQLAEEEKRCMIWCEDGGLPTVAHPTWGAAVKEAHRLSRLHPGHRFHLMQTKRVYFKAPEEASAPEEQAA